MRYWKLSLLVVFFTIQLSAQDYYLNRFYHLNDNGLATGIKNLDFERKKYLLVYENTIRNIESISWVFEVDEEGEIVDSISVKLDSVFLFPGGMFVLEDSLIIIPGVVANNLIEASYPYFCRINTNEKSVSIKTFNPIPDEHDSPRRFIRTKSNDYIGAGYTTKNDFSQLYLVKINQEGDLEWERAYGSPGWQDGWSVVELSDGGFAIGGWKRIGSSARQEHYIVRTDSVGNVIWEKIWGGIDNGFVHLSLKSNGNLIGMTTRFRNTVKFNKHLVELNPSNGAIIRERTYEQEWNNSFRTPALILPGDTMLVGGYQDVVNADSTRTNRLATVTKLDPQGNVIWERMFYKDPTRSNFLNGINLLPDGRIMAYGQNVNTAWLVELDSMGCPYPDCDSISVSTESITPDQDIFFDAYPNPASQSFRIYYKTLQQSVRPKIDIFDLQGRPMATIPLNREAPQGDVMVDCSDWPAGIYVLKLSTSKGLVGTRKVVVQR